MQLAPRKAVTITPIWMPLKYCNFFLLFNFCLFIYFLAVLGLCCFMGFIPVETSMGYSLVTVLGLLIAVVSLVAEDGL